MNDQRSRFLAANGVSIAAGGLVVAAVLLTASGAGTALATLSWVCAAIATVAAVRVRRAR